MTDTRALLDTKYQDLLESKEECNDGNWNLELSLMVEEQIDTPAPLDEKFEILPIQLLTVI